MVHLSLVTVSRMQVVLKLTQQVKLQVIPCKILKVTCCLDLQHPIINNIQANFQKARPLINDPMANSQSWESSRLKEKKLRIWVSEVLGVRMIAVIHLRGFIREARWLIVWWMRRKRLIRIHLQKMKRLNQWALILLTMYKRKLTQRRIFLAGTWKNQRNQIQSTWIKEVLRDLFQPIRTPHNKILVTTS